MEETEEAREHWREELDRLTELRDNAAKVQAGLDYATQFLTSLQAELPDFDQTLDELKAMSQDDRNDILKARQKIIRALCEKIEVSSDRQIKLYGVLDGTEAGEFDLGPYWTSPSAACAAVLDSNQGPWTAAHSPSSQAKSRCGFPPSKPTRQMPRCCRWPSTE